MLDMGFADDMAHILGLCTYEERQTASSSATLPPWVRTVAPKFMRTEPQVVDLVGNSEHQASTDVRHVAIPAPGPVNQRADTINDVIAMFAGATGRSIIFCETRNECDELVNAEGLKLEAKPLHGDIPQAARNEDDGRFPPGPLPRPRRHRRGGARPRHDRRPRASDQTAGAQALGVVDVETRVRSQVGADGAPAARASRDALRAARPRFAGAADDRAKDDERVRVAAGAQPARRSSASPLRPPPPTPPPSRPTLPPTIRRRRAPTRSPPRATTPRRQWRRRSRSRRGRRRRRRRARRSRTRAGT